MYDGTAVTQITNNIYDNYSPQINDSGYIVWHGGDGSDDEIFVYDGTTIKQLTNNTYNDSYPQTNNNGDIAWQGFNGPDYEIFLATIAVEICNAVDDDGDGSTDEGLTCP